MHEKFESSNWLNVKTQYLITLLVKQNWRLSIFLVVALFYKDCLTNDKTQFSFVASNLYAAFLPHDFVKYFIFSDKLSLHCCTKKNAEKLHSENVSRCFYIEKHISDIYLTLCKTCPYSELFLSAFVPHFPAFVP